MPELEVRIWPEVGDPAGIDLALVWRAPPGELARYANAFQVTGNPQDRGLADDTYKTVGRVCGGSYRLGAPPEGVPPSQ